MLSCICLLCLVISLLSADVDYIPVWVDRTFSADNSNQSVCIEIIDDDSSELDESFYVLVDTSDPGCIGSNHTRVTIIDDDGHGERI